MTYIMQSIICYLVFFLFLCSCACFIYIACIPCSLYSINIVSLLGDCKKKFSITVASEVSCTYIYIVYSRSMAILSGNRSVVHI